MIVCDGLMGSVCGWRLVLACLGVCLCVSLLFLLGVGSAFADGSVWWGVTSGSWPASVPAGGTGRIIVTGEDRGDVSADGKVSPVVVRDVLPVGVRAVEKNGVLEAEGIAGENAGVNNRGNVDCSLVSSREVVCEFTGVLPAYEEIEVRISVRVEPGIGPDAPGLVNVVSVSGGGAEAPDSVSRGFSVGEEPGFGLEAYELLPEDENGVISTQAGQHPFQLTSVLGLNADSENEPVELAKDLKFLLPPGLIGNPTPFPQCTDAQFSKQEAGTSHNECSAQTAIGVATVTYNVTYDHGSPNTRTVPLFNLAPLVGEPARFGFEILHVPVTVDASVPAGGNYPIIVNVNNIGQTVGFIASKVTFWGVPGSPVHDAQRGWNCLEGNASCSPLGETNPPPFLSLPTSCEGPLLTSVEGDSWDEPKPAHLVHRGYEIEQLDGCNHLQFDPSISVTPDVLEASTPTGLDVKIRVPQTAALNPEGLAESALRSTTVLLPPGVEINPGGADGLEACSESQIGYLGKENGGLGTDLFTPEISNPVCPNGAKIATAKIKTPLLPEPLVGAMYLAAQNENPFGSLVAMYLVVEDPVAGVKAKVAGEVTLQESGPNTGQVLATFENTPQVPLEEIELHFFGESRAPLGTPAFCGSYTTSALFGPWSGSEPVARTGTFHIDSGPDRSPCPGRLPFTPTLAVGTTSNQAGGFSPLTTTMSREDGNQNLKAVSLDMPPGLSGVLTGVSLCGEAQADAGTCGPESEIGETTVSVGLGGNPYTVKGGKVYLTGPYEGAPFGLSIVNPANAGPFHLGNVIVRAKVEVDRHTAALRVTTNSSGAYAIPQFIRGIPLQIKHVNVTIDRNKFTFNPTNCSKLEIKGVLTSQEETNVAVSESFQAVNCAALKFKPALSVSTSGKTSRKDGASLHVKLAYPNEPLGTQANISAVKVDLPKQLPSRLTTLQKACPAATFESNHAACPPASIVGTAKAVTPSIPVPLEGPAYFVSHGGEAFPSLIIVLQGYGVTVELVGTTFISKAGITSSTFKAVPDVPVGTFELTLPEKPYSALAANGNLCKSKLAMPTAFTAQNGRQIHETTKITVTGCPKTKKAENKKAKKTHSKHSGKH
jgi:hypothetical protein